MLLHNPAEAMRKRVKSELPEFVQLIAATMAAGVSMDEALRRSTRVENITGRWMRRVVEKSSGRMLIEQLQKEAWESQMTELITFAVQMEFVRLGSNQQELMGTMAAQIAQDYIGQANERAAGVTTTLAIYVGVFFFIPFVLTVLVLVGGQALAGFLGG
jgi:Flp pilus assembly protein TadB